MKNVRVLFLSAILIGSIACQKKNRIAEHERKIAPTGEADVGFVVETTNTDEIENLLSAHPEARVRVVSEKHGMFEIFGVDKFEIKKFVNARVEKNLFVRAHNTPQSASGIFSVPIREGLEVPGLNKCKNGILGPRAVLNVTQPIGLSNFATITLDQKIKVNSKASRPPFGGTLKSVIAILPPPSSAQGEQILPLDEAEFTPDALGMYQVTTIVQDGNDVCAMDGIAFLVTVNRPYNGPETKGEPAAMSQFTHLPLVSAKESWALSEGEGQVIAIIDTGVNYNHPTLAANIQLNETEVEGNDEDEDGAGFKNDILGWDFVNNDEFPYDDSGHGSHVAGLAASREFGLARKAKILPIKAMTDVGGDVMSIAAAIRYAADRGARIINLSLGAEGPEEHPLMISAIAYAESKGVLLIVASGNGDMVTGTGFDIDTRTVWPASLTNENILTVAAFDRVNPLSPYSNYGQSSVDVIAPGGWLPFDAMVSATHENPLAADLVAMSGTSMAAPVVAGIAAQVWSLRPSLTIKELKEILIQAGPEVPNVKGVSVSGRHINSLSALELLAAPTVLN